MDGRKISHGTVKNQRTTTSRAAATAAIRRSTAEEDSLMKSPQERKKEEEEESHLKMSAVSSSSCSSSSSSSTHQRNQKRKSTGSLPLPPRTEKMMMELPTTTKTKRSSSAPVAISKNDLYQYWLSKIKDSWWTLEDAPEYIRNNKCIVITAVQQDGYALKYATPKLQNDIQVVLVAIRNDGGSLQFASPQLKQNKDVVLTAINQNPNSIKYAHQKIKHDPDLLIASGMFDDDKNSQQQQQQQQKKMPPPVAAAAAAAAAASNNAKVCDGVNNNNNNSNKTKKIKITLSTRFSLHASSWSEATNFTKLLKQHEYIRGGKFKIYAPNAYDKKTCDPNWTDFIHPCQGTKETCQYDNVLTKSGGHPTDDCCWRYSFRHQLLQSKSTNGFMIQLIEKNPDQDFLYYSNNADDHNKPRLGNGQQIERRMAQQLNLKIFHVYRPVDNYGDEYEFNQHSINIVVMAIKNWYDYNNHRQCQDDNNNMSECIIRPKYKEH